MRKLGRSTTKIKMGDIIIFILSLVLIAASFQPSRNLSGEPELHVRANNREYVYDLSVDTQAVFTGPIGETAIEIVDGRVHVPHSDCRNKICVSAGWISKPGEWIICLPNDVFISIEGKVDYANNEVDDLAF